MRKVHLNVARPLLFLLASILINPPACAQATAILPGPVVNAQWLYNHKA